MKLKNESILKFVSNTGWILFKEVYAVLISLIIGSLSARYLGPSNYGLISYGGALISFFLIVTQLGMGNVIVLELVRDEKKTSCYLGTALIMRLAAAIVSLVVIYGIISVLEPDNMLLHFITILQALSIVFQASDVLYYWFQAKMEMKYVTLTGMIALTLTSVWRIMLLAKNASVEWFAVSASISAFLSCIAISIFYIYRAKTKLIFNFTAAKYIFKNSVHFMVNSVTMTFYTQLDKIMIGKMLDETFLGFYTAAVSISVIWEVLPNAILNSARPLFVQKFDTDEKEFLRRYQIVLLGITVLGAGVGFGFTIFAKLFVWLLYGTDYYAAIPALRILIWASACSAVGTGRSIWMVLNQKGKYMEYFTLIGAAINVTLNIVFIYLWGYMGAAFATLITNIITGVFLPFFFRETRAYAFIYFGSFKQIPLLLKYIKSKLPLFTFY